MITPEIITSGLKVFNKMKFYNCLYKLMINRKTTVIKCLSDIYKNYESRKQLLFKVLIALAMRILEGDFYNC